MLSAIVLLSTERDKTNKVAEALADLEGVSEVASVGGYVRQYQIEVDPDALRFHDIPLDRLIEAVENSNIDVGAKTVESGGMEYVIRGRGFIGQNKDTEQARADIEQTVVLSRSGIPVPWPPRA